MHLDLVMVPWTVGRALAKLFTGIGGDGAANAHKCVEDPAGRAIQNTAVPAFAFNDTIPFDNGCLHDTYFVHVASFHTTLMKSFEQIKLIGFNPVAAKSGSVHDGNV